MAPVDTRNQSISEKVTELNEFGVFELVTTTPGDTTTDAAAAKGDVALSVVAETNFVAEEYAIVDEGNLMKIVWIEATAAGSLTLKSGLAFAHASGVVVKEVAKLVLGDTTEDGFQDPFTGGVNVHNVGTRHGPWDATPGHHEQELEATVVNATLDNFLKAIGLVAGTDSGGLGTAVDPWYLDVDPERIYKAMLQSGLAWKGRLPGVYIKGEYLNTGEIFEAHYMSCAYAGGDQGFQIQKGGDGLVTVPFRYIWFANKRLMRYTP